eukprot:Em0019g1009a
MDKKTVIILEKWSFKRDGKNLVLRGHKFGDLCDQVWSSSAVVARVAARTLVTKSGTLYKLKGWLREDDELYEGFSKKLVALFKRGFPVNWEKALREDQLSSPSPHLLVKKEVPELDEVTVHSALRLMTPAKPRGRPPMPEDTDTPAAKPRGRPPMPKDTDTPSSKAQRQATNAQGYGHPSSKAQRQATNAQGYGHPSSKAQRQASS